MHFPHVLGPSGLLPKCHGADLAHKGLFARVDQPVPLHGLLLRERLVAEVAGERLLARVRADVALGDDT